MELYVINILIILAVLIPAAYFDLKRKEIPNSLTYPLIVSGFVYSMLPWNILNIWLAGAVFVIGYLLNKHGDLGGGDVKLLTGMVLWTPPEFFSMSFFLTLFLMSCVCALIYFGIMILTGKEKLSKNALIKFGPCILVGYVIAVVSMFL